jgi:Phytanoyl-CoA dioxygenase (PhyH)
VPTAGNDLPNIDEVTQPGLLLVSNVAAMNDAGFSIFEGVLSSQECELLANALCGVALHRGRAGTRNLMSNAAICRFAHDSRLLDLAGRALGADAVPFRATFFNKSARSNWHVLWHQDRALPLAGPVASTDWGPWSMKSGVLNALAPAWALKRIVALRIHIDESTSENGPLRVIPGSHEAGVLSSTDILQATNGNPAKACVVGRGGVVAMRPLLIHSSTRALNSQPRRVLHIEYATNLDLGNDVRLRVE